MKPFLEPLLFRLRLRKVINYIPKKGRVCDICCGVRGQFLFEIKHFIKEGIGLDKEVDFSTNENILLKKVELIKRIEERSDYFDCVTLLAALEHLLYPREIIKECFRILRPGGKILITTPPPKSKAILEFLAFKIGIVSPEQIRVHERYFNEESLIQLCIAAGFRKEKIVVEKFELGYNLFLHATK